ncbi:chemotaxis response regulator protein-glutamate methylesterase [Terribacillus sp. 7520-G]|uniref:protein-glutamate methylesterase/protein-glutamine glutaminase n=1 Tax=unclassified Terribacillus TaxID=2636508 RepID=UPI000BA67D23|nr:chemotaxis response regulator protein-glutamate methylesterase [Terribacillus sp. 7520-G]PAD40081.1 chemotaxis response regulator protein-glutamate methylesterase [Terribacillus sp. 7520-G]
MEKIRVLVVDDSAFMRKIISDLLNGDERLEVIGTARNGKDGLEQISQLKPDVVTMDVEMPIMDGLEALKEIMRKHPLPVVMLSSLTKQGADMTIHAMSLGAVDFIAKPSGSISLDLDKVRDELVVKVVAASSSRLSVKQRVKAADVKMIAKAPERKRADRSLVAIGTSTGGPRALQEVVGKLPSALAAPVVVVQHMPVGFTKSLAERLDGLSAISVKEAQQNEILKNGVVYIAPGGQHLTIEQADSRLIAKLTMEEPVKGHRPSVDRMFESISSLENVDICTVIMTGMGADGTDGLRMIRDKHPSVYSIGESAESCVVYGMPRAAAEAGLLHHVCPVQSIASAIQQRVNLLEGVNQWK